MTRANPKAGRHRKGPAAYRVEDLRKAEQQVMALLPDGALMQQAAAGLAVSCARVLRERTGGISGRRAVLLVGPGDNGGDALFAGVRLVRRGVAVTALLTAEKSHPLGSAALAAAGGRCVEVGPDTAVEAWTQLEAADLVVDGLLGLGGRPGLREPAAGLVDRIPDHAAVVAVDLPSGVDPDTGATLSPYVWADLTVTFGAAKACLLLPPASSAAGDLEIIDIGLAPYLPSEPLVSRLSAADVARLWPVPSPGADKYRRGVLGVVAGSAGYPGAAVLAVAGALRTGVGMVRYVGPKDATAAVRSAWPEVVSGTGRVQAWLLGSGVVPDTADQQPEAIHEALESDHPCLLDAGALGLFPAELRAHTDSDGAVPDRSDRLLLTPHAGELARLLTDLGEDTHREEVENQPYAFAHRAARLTGATVLLKGSTTLVVRPDGHARSQAEAPSWLATAGAGDVLAGIAGALLASGLSPFDAGSVAAFVHGRAGSKASGGGPITSIDVADQVPSTVAALLSH
ncbi:bifunctional ADP-dependent NAD(P)H-hydrate dehydratase/NAD(P)H-hydrate epimerase [Kineosporia mesophila]|uniref:Bifunctional NAD(P)H-hydrate repair enzyme n=1 Tax=Kineosporia mesophila TaxID=566012 RepID=A0ABP6ZPX9_9ACTN|nr:NAD(P)H-hydrate dehydratase [Kineosporia mesophila]MCD5349958.1 NAD(P)H-hydrate dehydratase [Kineosporia mesophila]